VRTTWSPRRTLVTVAAAAEAATGVALIVAGSKVSRWLLGSELAGAGVPLARLAGIALVALAVAAWPGREATPAGARALLLYNLLAGAYLAFLGVEHETCGVLLWPACALHAAIAILLVVSRWRD
jgi:hypothetical protein